MAAQYTMPATTGETSSAVTATMASSRWAAPSAVRPSSIRHWPRPRAPRVPRSRSPNRSPSSATRSNADARLRLAALEQLEALEDEQVSVPATFRLGPGQRLLRRASHPAPWPPRPGVQAEASRNAPGGPGAVAGAAALVDGPRPQIGVVAADEVRGGGEPLEVVEVERAGAIGLGERVERLAPRPPGERLATCGRRSGHHPSLAHIAPRTYRGPPNGVDVAGDVRDPGRARRAVRLVGPAVVAPGPGRRP